MVSDNQLAQYFQLFVKDMLLEEIITVLLVNHSSILHTTSIKTFLPFRVGQSNAARNVHDNSIGYTVGFVLSEISQTCSLFWQNRSHIKKKMRIHVNIFFKDMITATSVRYVNSVKYDFVNPQQQAFARWPNKQILGYDTKMSGPIPGYVDRADRSSCVTNY